MNKLFVLLLFISCSGKSKAPPPPVQATGGAPTMLSAEAIYDCQTRLPPTMEALLSDGTYQKVNVYPANSDGSSPSITCDANYSTFSLVNCNDTAVGFFCLPSSFTCNYLAPDGFTTQEICEVPPSS
jgi:hypothetical protein